MWPPKPDLAAGVRRVKGVKKIGVRLGNWFTAEQSQRLWQVAGGERLKEKRDRALLAVLHAFGLRRHGTVELNFGDIQQHEEHWAIVDLKGKADTPTIPMPAWVKSVVDLWIQAANTTSGKLFRRVHKTGITWGRAADGKGGLARGSWSMPRRLGSRSERPTISAEPVHGFATPPEANWSKSGFC